MSYPSQSPSEFDDTGLDAETTQSEETQDSDESLDGIRTTNRALQTKFEEAFGEENPSAKVLNLLLNAVNDPSIYETLFSDVDGNNFNEKATVYLESVDSPETVLQELAYLIPFNELEELHNEMLDPECFDEQDFDELLEIWATTVEAVYEDRVHQKQVFDEFSENLKEKREQAQDQARDLVLKYNLDADLMEPVARLFSLDYTFFGKTARPDTGWFLMFKAPTSSKRSPFAYLLVDSASIVYHLPQAPKPQPSPQTTSDQSDSEEDEWSEGYDDEEGGEFEEDESEKEEPSEEELARAEEAVDDAIDAIEHKSDEEIVEMTHSIADQMMNNIPEDQLHNLVEAGIFDSDEQAERFYNGTPTASEAREFLSNFLRENASLVARTGVEMGALGD